MLRALFALCTLFGAGLAAFILPAQAQKPGPPACPERLVGQASLVCACSAEAAASGSVWGDDLYTDDSAICRAAVHAGTITAGGGTIWVFERPGQDSYAAVTRNGIASNSWPAWRRSIAFRPAADADAAEGADVGPRVEPCPANLAGLSVGTSLSCACTIEAMSSGSIWGDGIYTADSILCRAARHAGAIGAYGGNVRARVVAGRGSYPAATRNGIASGSWASYGASLAFDR
jgi:hypothetical protein